jgi:hypothetical protein
LEIKRGTGSANGHTDTFNFSIKHFCIYTKNIYIYIYIKCDIYVISTNIHFMIAVPLADLTDVYTRACIRYLVGIFLAMRQCDGGGMFLDEFLSLTL